MKTINEVIDNYNDLVKYDLSIHRDSWKQIIEKLKDIDYPELHDREYRILIRREENKVIYELCTVCHPEIEELDEIDISDWHDKNKTLCVLLEV